MIEGTPAAPDVGSPEPPTDLPDGAHRRPREPEAEARSWVPEQPKPGPHELPTVETGPVVLKEPPDWTHFAPEGSRSASAPVRVGRRLGRARPVRTLWHEWTLAWLAGVALTLAVNWRALTDLTGKVPADLWDSARAGYLVAWDGYALRSDPAAIWHLNAYYPSGYGLAMGDSLLGYAPLGMLGSGPAGAVLRLNLLLLFAQALAFVGAYALARQLGVGRVAGAVAGVAFAFAPWRLGQGGHLEILSTGGIPLALAMLCRGHGWRLTRPDPDAPGDRRPRPGWALAGWLIATWQLAIGWGLGVVLAYAVGGLFLLGIVWWLVRRRGWPGWWLVSADTIGAAVFVLCGSLLALPYLLAPAPHPNGDAAPIVGPARAAAYLTAPAASLVWGHRHEAARADLGGVALLPGFVLYALAAAGLVYSVWAVHARLLLLAGVACALAAGMGERGPFDGWAYARLRDLLPRDGRLNVPAELVAWATLLLALLAAGAVAALRRRAGAAAQARGFPRPRGLANLAVAIPLALVLVEGIGTPPRVRTPAEPPVLSEVRGPVLVLPSDARTDALVSLWSTDGFPALVNGAGPYAPADLITMRERVAAFPDAASLEYLRQQGVRTVVVLPDRLKGTPWEGAADIPVTGSDVTREERDGAVVFRLG